MILNQSELYLILRQALTHECGRPFIALRVELKKNRRDSLICGVSVDLEITVEIRLCEDRSRNDGFLNSLKGNVGFRSPFEFYIFAQ